MHDVTTALRALEPIFHRSAPGSRRDAFAAFVADDYWEVGASGTVYDRQDVLAELDRRAVAGGTAGDEDWVVDDFAVRPLGPGTWLATYALDQAGRRSRRATVWQEREGRWVALYHQGTLAPGR